MTPNTTVGGLKPEELRAAVRVWKAYKAGIITLGYMNEHPHQYLDMTGRGKYFHHAGGVARGEYADPNDALDALGID